MAHWVLICMVFECVRCSREVKNEECYLLFNKKYCKACMIWIESDIDNIFWRLKQIEN